MPKTLSEINELKRLWLNDPCWDIYNTEGFEGYAAELSQYQSIAEKKWADARRDHLMNRSIELGIGGEMKLVAYLESLEQRLEKLGG